ncbi:hypothetical protein CYMTET_10537 [Cymbomonas tetramitiformis]|uniref:Apple domain-containing protein n=1 Tax=Cymbomonas tetramitiformis TaxID=36881 RepID=A0AAE0GPA7_9CHLO|nr:hypothetical protein CYMTET_10537 [Cymbomonas tetramitiformis]
MAYLRVFSALFIAAQVGTALAGKVCEKSLYTDSYTTCDGSKTEWGAYGKILTDLSLEKCQDACADDFKCNFAQYQAKRDPPTCHLYEDCDTERIMAHQNDGTISDVYSCEVEGKTCEEVLYSQALTACDGTGSEWGPFGLQISGLSKKECKQKCVENVDCQAVQFQADRQPTSCHLYTDCEVSREIPNTGGNRLTDVWQCSDSSKSEEKHQKRVKKEQKESGDEEEEKQTKQTKKETQERVEKEIEEEIKTEEKHSKKSDKHEKKETDGKQCTDVVYSKSYTSCDGSSTEWGKFGKQLNGLDEAACILACEDEKLCGAIAFQEKRQACHLYEDCDTTREISTQSESSLTDVFVCHGGEDVKEEAKECTTVLFEESYDACDGTGSDWGQFGHQVYHVTEEECQEACVSEELCVAVQYQAHRDPPTCHLYENCDTKRTMRETEGSKSNTYTCTGSGSKFFWKMTSSLLVFIMSERLL